MKTKFTKKGRRILSAALCLLMMITALPMSAFTDEKSIAAMTMDDILAIQGITIADIGIINELQKSIKANKVISFFSGEMKE